MFRSSTRQNQILSSSQSPSRKLLGFALSAFAFASFSGSAQANEPRHGDVVNGAKLYQLHCGECHGSSGLGDGPLAAKLPISPANLKDGGLLWALTDEGLFKVISEGGAATDKSTLMPAHADSLTELERRDIVLWLKQDVPPLSQFFPLASRYVAHEHTIDQYGQERAKEALGRDLKEDELSHMVFTLFAPEKGPKPPGEPTRVPETPAALYAAKPKDKVGFVVYLPLTIEGKSIRAGLALDHRMVLTEVVTVPSADPTVERVRRRYASTLSAFAGSGGRMEKKPVRPYRRGVTASRPLLAEMNRAFVVVLEAVAMWEKEERDRFWADPDAFRRVDDMPDEVQFDMKNRRR